MFLVAKREITEHKGDPEEMKKLLLRDDYLYACFLYSDPLSPLFVHVKPGKARLMADWESNDFWFMEVPTSFLYPSETSLRMGHGASMAHFSRLGWIAEDDAWIENRMPVRQYEQRIQGLLGHFEEKRLLFFGSLDGHDERGETRRSQVKLLETAGFTIVTKSFFPEPTRKLIDVLEDERCCAVLGMDGLSVGCMRDHEVALSAVPYLRVTRTIQNVPFVNPTGRAWVATAQGADVGRAFAEMKASASCGTMSERLLDARDVSLAMRDNWRFFQCLDACCFDSDSALRAAEEIAIRDASIPEAIEGALPGKVLEAEKVDTFMVFDSDGSLLPGRFKIGEVHGASEGRPALLQSLVGEKGLPKNPLISFVVPCMGRLEHLQRALPRLSQQPNSEVVIVDWSCPEYCGDWADKFPRTRVVRVPGQRTFNLSKARNAGAGEARGEWLCFLDCDMIVSPKFATELSKGFKDKSYVSFGTLGSAGHSGMTTCRKADWEAVGGYDGRMEGWGYEDTDFKHRLRLRGLSGVVVDMSLAKHIDHDNEARTRFYDDDQATSHGRNEALSQRKIKDRKKIVGLWKATHSSWKGFLFFDEDGSFSRQAHGDHGSWLLEDGELVLRWAKWPPERLKEKEPGQYAGTFMTLSKEEPLKRKDDESLQYVGDWTVRHDDWKDTISLLRDGTFHRSSVKWEGGTWESLGGRVLLKWDRWGTETANYEDGSLVGDRFVAVRPWRLEHPKISLCTTCKGRLWQLSRTFLGNVRRALEEYDNVEFVLMDYGSQDGLEDWARTKLRKYVDEGIVKYCKLVDDLPWHASKSRNLAHRMASGVILCNVDADNFLGEGFVKKLSFEVGPKKAVRLAGDASVGGRIAVHKDDFFAVGGYLESLAPMGHLDNEFERRLGSNGVRVIHWPSGPLPVENTDAQRAEFCDRSYAECMAHSKKVMDRNPVVNERFQRATVRVNWSRTVELGPERGDVRKKLGIAPAPAKVRIVSFFKDNIPEEARSAQRAVMRKFGQRIEQFRFAATHQQAIDGFMSEMDWSRHDFLVILDIDAVPTSDEGIPYMVEEMRRGRLVGCAQAANHGHMNRDHVYVGPFCVGLTRDVFEALGRPSFLETARSDVGQELTWLAQEKNVPVSMMLPTSVEEPRWALGPTGKFGLGTGYGVAGVELFWHAFESRYRTERFVRKCKELLA